MSKKRSVWKNTPEGKTIRRNSVAEYFTSRPVALLETPAFRVLSRAAHLAMSRIELELRHHAGNGNGKLIVTKQQFIEYGLHKDSIAPALRELEALGIIIITQRGRGGNAEHRQPNRFLLNYMCGAVDAHEQVTNTWKRVQTVDEAEKLCAEARESKDPKNVAYGRRNAARKTRPPKPGLAPDPETGTETAKFSDPETGTTIPDPETGTTIDISVRSRATASMPTEADQPKLPWTPPQLIEITDQLTADEMARLMALRLVDDGYRVAA